MAKDKRSVMKNRAKKAARDKAKRKERAKKQAGKKPSMMPVGCNKADLENAPVLAVYVTDSLEQNGMGSLLIARQLEMGLVFVGVFLVDMYCLGVKNAFVEMFPPADYERFVEQFSAQGLREVSAAYAAKLIDGAVAYADGFGFKPHKDFKASAVVLANIDRNECDETFEFGKNGKPLFIPGPNDSEQKVVRILRQLQPVSDSD